MAIRFQCSGCSQPIEVDDEWAEKTVACPYCRRTITAPAESTLPDPNEIPIASPTATAESAQPPPASYPPSGPDTNRIAVVALVLACLVLVLLGLGVTVAASHSLEFTQLQEELEASREGSASQVEVFTKFIDAHGGVPPGWMIAMGLLELGAMGASIAAIICGVLGLRRAHRRPLAVAALVICGGIIVVFCASLLSSLV